MTTVPDCSGRTASSGRRPDFSSAWAARNPAGRGAEGSRQGPRQRPRARDGPRGAPAGPRPRSDRLTESWTGQARLPPSRRTSGHPQAGPQSPLQANGRAVQDKPCECSGCGAPDFSSLRGEGRPLSPCPCGSLRARWLSVLGLSLPFLRLSRPCHMDAILRGFWKVTGALGHSKFQVLSF